MKKIISIIIFLLSSGSILMAQKTFTDQGKAIRGFDPVAYHREQRAVPGNDSLNLEWNNARWFFSNRENLELFRSNPGGYAPAYGGYCAFGVSEDHLSPTDPKAFTIVKDTLYLNYSLKVKELWLKDTAQRIQNANKNWTKLK